jgi:FecR protein
MKRSSLVLLMIAAAVSLSAQSVISAHSGTIHYTEGQVTLDGTAVQPKFGEFPEVKVGQVLSAQDGRAEILLTPGVFLRLGENSGFKMISNQLTNTRLEISSGEAMIEVGELLPDNAITVVFHGADISIAKRGLYRIDSDPARLRVYEGEVSVVSASIEPMKIGKGRELAFDEPKLEAKSFDTKSTDEFYRWGARRDEYVAQANLSAAKSARDSGYSGMGYSGMGMSGAGMNGGMGSWAWNPWFGMFTYLPGSGMYSSPYGFGYFSPYSVGYMYGPYSPYAYGNGYTGFSGTGIARGGVVSSASAPTTSLGTTRAAGFNGGMANSNSNSGSAFGSASGGRGGGGSTASSSGGFGSGGGIASGGASHGSSGASGGKR